MEKPVEYVDKSAVLDAIANVGLEVKGDAVACEAVKYIMGSLAPKIKKAVAALPAAEVEPVVYAHWEDVGHLLGNDKIQIACCSHCHMLTLKFSDGEGIEPHTPRCSYCGAHMGKEAGNGKAN